MGAGRKKWPRRQALSQTDFDAIQMMLKGGALCREISAVMHVSESTVSECKRAGTWENYLEWRRARAEAWRAKHHGKPAGRSSAPRGRPGGGGRTWKEKQETARKMLNSASLMLTTASELLRDAARRLDDTGDE